MGLYEQLASLFDRRVRDSDCGAAESVRPYLTKDPGGENWFIFDEQTAWDLDGVAPGETRFAALSSWEIWLALNHRGGGATPAVARRFVLKQGSGRETREDPVFVLPDGLDKLEVDKVLELLAPRLGGPLDEGGPSADELVFEKISEAGEPHLLKAPLGDRHVVILVSESEPARGYQMRIDGKISAGHLAGLVDYLQETAGRVSLHGAAVDVVAAKGGGWTAAYDDAVVGPANGAVAPLGDLPDGLRDRQDLRRDALRWLAGHAGKAFCARFSPQHLWLTVDSGAEGDCQTESWRRWSLHRGAGLAWASLDTDALPDPASDTVNAERVLAMAGPAAERLVILARTHDGDVWAAAREIPGTVATEIELIEVQLVVNGQPRPVSLAFDGGGALPADLRALAPHLAAAKEPILHRVGPDQGGGNSALVLEAGDAKRRLVAFRGRLFALLRTTEADAGAWAEDSETFVAQGTKHWRDLADPPGALPPHVEPVLMTRAGTGDDPRLVVLNGATWSAAEAFESTVKGVAFEPALLEKLQDRQLVERLAIAAWSLSAEMTSSLGPLQATLFEGALAARLDRHLDAQGEDPLYLVAMTDHERAFQALIGSVPSGAAAPTFDTLPTKVLAAIGAMRPVPFRVHVLAGAGHALFAETPKHDLDSIFYVGAETSTQIKYLNARRAPAKLARSVATALYAWELEGGAGEVTIAGGREDADGAFWLCRSGETSLRRIGNDSSNFQDLRLWTDGSETSCADHRGRDWGPAVAAAERSFKTEAGLSLVFGTDDLLTLIAAPDESRHLLYRVTAGTPASTGCRVRLVGKPSAAIVAQVLPNDRLGCTETFEEPSPGGKPWAAAILHRDGGVWLLPGHCTNTVELKANEDPPDLGNLDAATLLSRIAGRDLDTGSAGYCMGDRWFVDANEAYFTLGKRLLSGDAGHLPVVLRSTDEFDGTKLRWLAKWRNNAPQDHVGTAEVREGFVHIPYSIDTGAPISLLAVAELDHVGCVVGIAAGPPERMDRNTSRAPISTGYACRDAVAWLGVSDRAAKLAFVAGSLMGDCLNRLAKADPKCLSDVTFVSLRSGPIDMLNDPNRSDDRALLLIDALSKNEEATELLAAADVDWSALDREQNWKPPEYRFLLENGKSAYRLNHLNKKCLELEWSNFMNKLSPILRPMDFPCDESCVLIKLTEMLDQRTAGDRTGTALWYKHAFTADPRGALFHVGTACKQ